MRLSISNIAWDAEDDTTMWDVIKKHEFQGIEIAPTRIIPKNPYDHIDQAEMFKQTADANGLVVSSMQSIWFGRSERLFFSDDERAAILGYTKKAIDFANILSCGNLVFGSPKNRQLTNDAELEAGMAWFKAAGEYAEQKNTCFSVEPNPTIYNTNFINETKQAFELAKRVNSKGFKVNVDFGTIIQNQEDLIEIEKNFALINHVHISEPFLAPIEKRSIHREMAALLKENKYQGFVSIEMKNPGDKYITEDVMAYVKEVFG